MAVLSCWGCKKPIESEESKAVQCAVYGAYVYCLDCVVSGTLFAAMEKADDKPPGWVKAVGEMEATG